MMISAVCVAASEPVPTTTAAPICTVSFNAGGGSPQPSPITVYYGGRISEPTPAPEKPGFDFTGWQDGDITFDFANTSIYQNMTLKANWSEVNVTFNYISSNTTMGRVNCSNETVGASTGVPTGAYAEAYRGYRFINWILDNTSVSDVISVTPRTGIDGVYHPGDYTAVFEEITCNVSYDAGNGNYSGSLPGPLTVTVNAEATVAPALELDGWSFTGWNSGENGSGTGFYPGVEFNFDELNDLADAAGNVILYGQWIRIYNITFDADGGEPQPFPTTVPENGKVAEPETPARIGFEFEEWRAEGSDSYYNFSDPVSSDLKIIAYYTEHTAVLSYSSEDPAKGTVTSESETVNVSTGTANGSVAVPAEGFRFVRWMRNGSEESTDPVFIPGKNVDRLYENASYIAAFEQIFYSVSYDKNNDDYNGRIPETSSVTVNKSVTAAPALELDGCVFTGWNTGKDGSGTGFTPDTDELNFSVLSDLVDGSGNVTLYGQWIRMYNVTFDADGGSPEPSPTATTVPEGGKVTEPAQKPEKPGFGFNGWKADGSDELYNFSDAVTGDLDLKADYTENTVTITYVSSDETKGSVSIPGETVSTVNGKPDGAVAEAAPGYHFINWTLNGTEVRREAAFVPPKDEASGMYIEATYVADFDPMLIEWNWGKISKTNYNVTATFTDENGTVIAENVRAAVTDKTAGDIVTYTAVVTFDGKKIHG
ncbi:MAG: InlB B-repeat-containing protein [Methanosarcinaceae archaeon]|nr:InlB B-repeat-containing protein [Methanosarcinaceae archaeon]